MSLEGHASKAGQIAIQAVFTTSDARVEDAFFPATVASIVGGPEERHRIKEGDKGVGPGGTVDGTGEVVVSVSEEEEGELQECGN